MSIDRKQQIVEALANPKATYAAIGAQFNLSRARIQQIAKKAGVRRTPGRKAKA